MEQNQYVLSLARAPINYTNQMNAYWLPITLDMRKHAEMEKQFFLHSSVPYRGVGRQSKLDILVSVWNKEMVDIWATGREVIIITLFRIFKGDILC